jgi:hypothetical protein
MDHRGVAFFSEWRPDIRIRMFSRSTAMFDCRDYRAERAAPRDVSYFPKRVRGFGVRSFV